MLSTQLLPGGNRGPANHVACRTLKTQAGLIFLQDDCSTELLEQLRADEGLCAFARKPEREYQFLLNVARSSDQKLTLAYTAAREIVGQITLAPADDWWQELDNVYEIGIEVSSGWRRLGIARQLLTLALEDDAVEDNIILAMGLIWHWDIEGTGLAAFEYRKFLEERAAQYGFSEYLTSEPNIRMHPANILLARIGSRVSQENMNRFFLCLLQSDLLPGLS